RMFEELEQLFWHQEEPFASSSIYAQWCVMRLAKENHVTVLLDGQGADEMLAGYHTYFDDMSDDLLKSLKLLSYFRLNRDCEALHGRTPGSVRRVVRQILPKQVKRPVKQIFNAMRSVRNIDPGYPTYPIEFKNVSGLRKILWWNTTRHGLNQLLRYADRNSMAHSREVRMPFLDHRLAEFVFTLPESWLHRHGWTKWILRVALRGILPEPIAQRVDKLAFMPPERRWLGPLVWKDIMLEQLAAGGTSAPLVSEPCIEAAELKVS
ncbi:MAG: asparagine synthase C-terminal domain-containing protein, partial [Pyrinomonadaceae bacterium]|nr:asparagine synthase C-terminal domain-containing protein [Pyrinomonadaceae bacterium]